jgi:hypothetical protein
VPDSNNFVGWVSLRCPQPGVSPAAMKGIRGSRMGGCGRLCDPSASLYGPLGRSGFLRGKVRTHRTPHILGTLGARRGRPTCAPISPSGPAGVEASCHGQPLIGQFGPAFRLKISAPLRTPWELTVMKAGNGRPGAAGASPGISRRCCSLTV